MNFEKNALIFKALSDPNRLKIVTMIADGEKCACDLIEEFSFSQPTLSHHMKILTDSGIVNSKRSGKWQYYRLNVDVLNELQFDMGSLLNKEQKQSASQIVDECKDV